MELREYLAHADVVGRAQLTVGAAGDDLVLVECGIAGRIRRLLFEPHQAEWLAPGVLCHAGIDGLLGDKHLDQVRGQQPLAALNELGLVVVRVLAQMGLQLLDALGGDRLAHRLGRELLFQVRARSSSVSLTPKPPSRALRRQAGWL